jgi:ribonucleotide reductase alpha subunit
MEVTLETTKELKAYTREEVFNSSLDYFKGDELAANVWINKYALKDSHGNVYELNPREMHMRLAKEISRIEHKFGSPKLTEDTLFQLFDKFKYIVPQGSPMAGIGNTLQYVSLSNCFVIGTSGSSDSYGSILKIDQEQVQLMKRRGGVGHDLSHIRPKSSPVENSALTSTGVVPFMERYSNSTREVAQDGRRGALMLSISMRHPDAEAFIDAKMDGTKVTGANVSVRIPDDFMEALISKEIYLQKYPVDSNTPIYTKTVDPNTIWNKIIHNAWKSAEPGVLFWDKIINESLPDRYADLGYKTLSTNPCVIGSTLIATADGRNAVSIEKLAEEGLDIPVYSTNIESGRTEIKIGRNPRKTGIKSEVWKLKLDDGSELISTPNHKILTKDLKYVELKDLSEGISIMPFNSFNSNGYRQVTNTGAKMTGGAMRNRRQYRLIHEFYKGAVDSKNFAIHHVDCNSKNDHISNLELMTHEAHRALHAKNMIGKDNPYFKMTDEWKFNFASHPGEKNGKYIDVNNQELVNQGKVVFEKEGKLTRQLWYDHAKINSLPQFLNNDFRFGTFQNFKNQVATNHKVVSVEFYGYEDVYNITVDDNHNYHIITSYEDENFITSSGICIKNCGEIPLCADDSCRLIAVNLYSYVNNPFTSEAEFNWELFKEHAAITTRIMDNIIELEIEMIDRILDKIKNDPEDIEIKAVEKNLWERIKKKCQDGRRTGIGITAEGDMIAAMGLRYGTPEATKFATEVHKQYALTVYRASCNLAKERGSFAIWDPKREEGAPILERIKKEDPALYADLMKYGRRNIALLTIAPTGSVSILTKTSSGIECAFLVSYRRRRKVNPNDKNVRIDFTDSVGDTWEEYNVFHHHFETWLLVNGYDLELVKSMKDAELNKIIEKSPYHKALANDVDWVEKVVMQGKIQQWIDHSISVTVNLPEHVDEALVNDVYVTAWKNGCKGCTIYRDGSRSGVLISNEVKQLQDAFKDNHAPKRPDTLDCTVSQFNNNKERWIGFIGLYDGRPYEIFTGKLEDFPVPNYVDEGKITKMKSKEGNNYHFVYKDKTGNEITLPNLNHAFDHTFYDMAKTISAIMRHGMPLPYVIDLMDSLNLDGDLINTWKSGVKRLIKKFIKDGTTVTGSTCQDCGSDALEYKEGCLSCAACGSSKCS